jgi:uncharacterized protein with NAD-binding domain and iron-sulfur cluster
MSMNQDDEVQAKTPRVYHPPRGTKIQVKYIIRRTPQRKEKENTQGWGGLSLCF